MSGKLNALQCMKCEEWGVKADKIHISSFTLLLLRDEAEEPEISGESEWKNRNSLMPGGS